MSTLRISVLGRVRLESGDTSVVVAGSLAAVLGYLAVHAPHGRLVGRDTVAFSLWPDRPEDRARRSLADALYRLRQMSAGCGADLFRADTDSLGFGDVAVDLDEFHNLVSLGQLEPLRSAIDLYDGDLVAEVDAEWITLPRRHLRDAFAAALGTLWELERANGDREALLKVAQRWAAFDRYDDNAHRAVMRSHALLGNIGEGLRYHDRVARELEIDLGVEPAAETRRVADQLRAEFDVGERMRRAAAVRAPFVGRVAERAQLLRLLDRCVDGSGGLAVVLGDAGIGKSRLLDEMSSAAAWRGVQVTEARVEEFRLAEPLAPLSDAIATMVAGVRRHQLDEIVDPVWLDHLVTIVPSLGDAAETRSRTTDPTQLRAALRQTLRGLQRIAPQLVLLDDLHWAGPGCWEAIDELRTATASMSVLIVVASRRNELRSRSDAWPILQNWDQAGVPIVHLTGMSVDEIGALSAGSSGAAMSRDALIDLQRSTSGNPLFAKSIIEAGGLDGERNTSLDQLLGRQLGDLGPATRRALDTAALIGSRVPYSLWRDASRADDLAARSSELEQVGMLVIESEGFRFAHDTLRHHVVGQIPPEHRRLIHGRLLELLAASTPDDVLTLLRHADGAGEHDAILRYSLEAGARSLDGGAFRVAVEQFTRALDLTSSDDALGRFVALVGRIQALDVLADRDAQRLDIDQLELIGPRIGGRHEIEALRMIAAFRFATGDYAAAEQTVGTGLQRLESTPYPELEAALLRTLSVTQREIGQYEESEFSGRAAREVYRLINDRVGFATMTDVLGGLAWRQGDLRAAADLHVEAADVFAEIGARVAEARALNNLGTAQWGLGAFVAAGATHRRALVICRELEDRRGEGDNVDNLGGVAWAMGDYAGAIALYHEALEIRRNSDDPWGVAISLGNLGDAHRLRHEFDQAISFFDEAADVNRTVGVARIAATTAQGKGLTLVDAGRFHEAIDLLVAATSAHIELGDHDNLVETRVGHARALLALGELRSATTLVDTLLVSERAQDRPTIHQSVHLLAHDVLSACGRDDDARRHLGVAAGWMDEHLDELDESVRIQVAMHVPLHRSTRNAVDLASTRLDVRLVRAGTPLGRPVTDDELVEVAWTLSRPGDESCTDRTSRRHRVLVRLLREAIEHGAAPTDDDLARAVGVSRRTIVRDMELLGDRGAALATRRRSRSTGTPPAGPDHGADDDMS